MEEFPADAWNIGLEYNKFRAGLAKSNRIDTDFIKKIRNRGSIENIKEVVSNYSLT